MGGTGRKIRKIQVMLTIMLTLCIMACGKEAQTDRESGNETETEHETADSSSEEDTPSGDEQETELPENVIEAYITENTEYTEEVIPVQYVDDLSLLADLKYTNSNYVYQDGKVYYRRYHEDSYEDKALWGDYDAIPGREKEIVCIDADGTETVLFTDKGNGDIYLINDRFYMRGSGTGGEDESGDTDTGDMLYSVDMQGNDRVDYGPGCIYAVDTERKIFILEMWENYHDIHYYVMNYETGERKPLFHDSFDNYTDISAYQDGWVYYTKNRNNYSAIRKLCAVSIEGEQREIIAITSARDYSENILDIKVDEDMLYFIFGDYGNSYVFQGGMLISVKLDGTDYKAVEIESDAFYLCHDKGKTLVYFPRYNDYFREDDGQDGYEMMVWDVEADICCFSDFPTDILYSYDRATGGMWRYYPANEGVLCDVTTVDAAYEGESKRSKTDVYAIPDDSGKIVRVVMDIEKYTTKWEEEEVERVTYEDFYFADGFLYFKTEYSTYDKETSVGWREGYRRLHTDIYRLKIGESKAKILYSY